MEQALMRQARKAARNQRILVIDDDSLIHRLVAVRIEDLNVSVISALDGSSGFQLAQETRPHLILLDVDLPDQSGFAVCERLRDSPLTREIPIIFLTGNDQAQEKVRAFEMGATDYVTKPFNPAELRARVRAALRMQALLEAFEMQALSDALTGLPNREAFRRSVAKCIEMAKQEEGQYRFALLFLDLDRFKVVNDGLGHAVGDQLLTSVANKLYQCVRHAPRDPSGVIGTGGRSPDVVARMGGDEFAILLSDVPDLKAVTSITERIQRELTQSYQLAGHHVSCGVSIGIRMCDGDCGDVEDVLRDSDTAMYHAKSAGKGRYTVFDDSMRERALLRLRIEDGLRFALRRREFQLVYQPILNLGSGQLEGFETLVRWNRPDGTVIGPAEFVPVAEETGLIHDIGRWILQESCIQHREWNRRFGTRLRMHVNFAKSQFISRNVVADVVETIEETGADPSLLTAEITESVIMHDSRVVVPMLQQLRDLGVSLAMDDFGTGYSSLASLHRFPISMLKIDREFVQRLSDNRPYAAIVHAIVSLAHNLDLLVVAEGVESAEEVVMLQTLECDYAQGFHFNSILDVKQAEALLIAEQANSNLKAA